MSALRLLLLLTLTLTLARPAQAGWVIPDPVSLTCTPPSARFPGVRLCLGRRGAGLWAPGLELAWVWPDWIASGLRRVSWTVER